MPFCSPLTCVYNCMQASKYRPPSPITHSLIVAQCARPLPVSAFVLFNIALFSCLTLSLNNHPNKMPFSPPKLAVSILPQFFRPLFECTHAFINFLTRAGLKQSNTQIKHAPVTSQPPLHLPTNRHQWYHLSPHCRLYTSITHLLHSPVEVNSHARVHGIGSAHPSLAKTLIWLPIEQWCYSMVLSLIQCFIIVDNLPNYNLNSTTSCSSTLFIPAIHYIHSKQCLPKGPQTTSIFKALSCESSLVSRSWYLRILHWYREGMLKNHTQHRGFAAGCQHMKQWQHWGKNQWP